MKGCLKLATSSILVALHTWHIAAHQERVSICLLVPGNAPDRCFVTPTPAVSHVLRSTGTWCVRAGAQPCAKATRWLLKALWPQTLLLTNLIRQEIHSYPILICWRHNIKISSFCQRSQSIPSNISYPENLSLWLPAKIPFLMCISSKSMAQKMMETNTYSKWASNQGWVDQVATGRFGIPLSSLNSSSAERRQNHGLYLEEKKGGGGEWATKGELLPLSCEGRLAAKRETAGKPRDGDRPFHSQVSLARY